jgi:hypothetical protein
VSDCMGQPPLIADNTHTTRLPAEVDEDWFKPASTSLPPVNEHTLNTSAYLVQKFRYALLLATTRCALTSPHVGLLSS